MTNYMLALVEATAGGLRNATNWQTNAGSAMIKQLSIATGAWTKNGVRLTPNESFTVIPSQFMPSWMSEAALSKMINNEEAALKARSEALQSKIDHDASEVNNNPNAGNSGWSITESRHERELSLVQKAEGCFVGSAKQEYANLMKGVREGSFVITGNDDAILEQHEGSKLFSKLNPSYVHEEVKSQTTMSCLGKHVASVIQENRSNLAIVAAAEVELGQAQAKQQQLVRHAQSGVQQSQTNVTMAADTAEQYAGAVAGTLNQVMQLTIRLLQHRM